MRSWTAKVLLLASFTIGSAMRAQDSVTTLAGQALTAGGTNGVGTNALFFDPAGMVSDSAGNLYIADSRNHVIRKLATNGAVSTFAGQIGAAGSNNGSTQARFNVPSGIAIDADGNFFVTDTGNHILRKITPAGTVSTIAGLAGQSGFTDGTGATARFNSPLGIAVSSNGTIYVADCGNHLIRTISTGGAVTTLAGTPETWGTNDGVGNAARFNGPLGLALDNEHNLFVSDSNNHTIRRIAPGGIVTTWAGVPGVDGFMNGNRLTATFAKPAELAFDAHGNLLIADSFNHVVREISKGGVVGTVTGLPRKHGSTDGVNGQGRLFNPYGLALNSRGALFVADAYNELIRVVLVPFTVRLEAADPSTAAISWNSEIGRKYQVQHRDDDTTTWSDLGDAITATEVVTSKSVGAATGETRLFRVIVVQ